MNKSDSSNLVYSGHRQVKTMHKIMMLRKTVVQGQVLSKGDLAEVGESDARYLVAKAKAKMHEEAKAKENPRAKHRK